LKEGIVFLQKKIKDIAFLLVQNSILEEPVETIVNPANEKLSHGGGVAGLIARQGGAEIQAESDRKAPIKTGAATFTTAGTLPFKYVIHTVGPIWQGGSRGEVELLRSAVLSALGQAAQLNLTSLSMPSISTGVFGYPLDRAIPIIIQAIFNFMTTASSLHTIRLCEFSEPKAMEIKEIIEAHLKENS